MIHLGEGRSAWVARACSGMDGHREKLGMKVYVWRREGGREGRRKHGWIEGGRKREKRG